MSIARFAIERPLYTWMIMLWALFGGLWGFNDLGRLEDPAFTIKVAVVSTQYPGATAEQVAREVTEPLEAAIQKMGEVDKITSLNQPGFSLITVEIKPTFDGSELPDVWTRLRAKVDNAARNLPEGAQVPFVNDGFGDVFGLYYAVTAQGYSDQEQHQMATFLQRELLAVDGVADVNVSGLPDEAIFVEPDLSLMVNQHIAPQTIQAAIANSNSVVGAGASDTGRTRTIIQAPDGSESVSAISGLSVGIGGEILNVVDVANVSRGRVSNPSLMIRFDGTEAFAIGIAGLGDENIVEVGNRVDARLAELQADIPVGVELHPIYQQHLVVDEASNAFLVNLAMSVAIVVAVLALAMGWRAAIVVGATLLLTVVGTLFFMAIFSIEMERISLGALIIAMGMLVDNAIVVAEGMQVGMMRGKTSREAADEATQKTQIPLLGATVIGIMAFAGIGLSPDATGEFLFSLFAVIGISLMLSWVLGVSVTPLLGHYFFKQAKEGGGDAYGGPLFRAYGAVLRLALRLRWLVIAALLGLTVVCFIGFGQVKQQFFPDSNTPLFFAHYKLPQGTSIHAVSEDLSRVEDWLATREEVVSVTSFMGNGATRFMLTYQSADANQSYGHLIIRTENLDQIPALQADLEAFSAQYLADGEFRTERLVFGPGGGAPIQARFSGSDPAVLRSLAQEAMVRMQSASSDLEHLRTNWREQELVIKPIYATERAQTAGIDREDIAATLEFATEGTRGGTYREGDRLIPIIFRLPQESNLTLLDQVLVSPQSGRVIPIEQVVDGLSAEVQNTLVHRRDRQLTITVNAGVRAGVNAAAVQTQIQSAVEAMELPIGYKMEWGGEYENSREAQASLGGQLPVSILIMVLISILLFNALKQPIIIWLLVPMSVNGVAIGLLGTGLPFSFTALLGLLSLSGMLIKNGIVLVEEIDLVRATGLPLRDAIVQASTSRLRPVVLAAATTILGMAPLLSDAFFVSMSVTIMGGLAFASVLTLVAAPVFYDVFFSREERRRLAKGSPA